MFKVFLERDFKTTIYVADSYCLSPPPRLSKNGISLTFQKAYARFWNQILGKYKLKINLYQNNGEREVWRRKGIADIPEYATLCVKHDEGSLIT